MFNIPSNVSQERFNPPKSGYLFSNLVTILMFEHYDQILRILSYIHPRLPHQNVKKADALNHGTKPIPLINLRLVFKMRAIVRAIWLTSIE